eukprot:5053131-Ditylum_brightwellii.AAC.1
MTRVIRLLDCELSSDEESTTGSGQSADRQDILVKFNKENPGKRNIFCDLLSGGSGGRTCLAEQGPSVTHGWYGFDRGVSAFFRSTLLHPQRGLRATGTHFYH